MARLASTSRSLPLVSCIMPTRNRRRFVSQAMSYFLRQDYPNRELVVLDDGEDQVADLIPEDSRIRYKRLDDATGIGRKRNIACELSRGELIANWDDDDWIGSDRLSKQVSAFVDADADVCGCEDVLYIRPRAGEAWLFHGSSVSPSWLNGGTLMYTREAWSTHPFADVTSGEDRLFTRRFAADRIHRMQDSSFYVGVLHGGNTTPANLLEPIWERQPLERVAHMLAADIRFYAAVRNGWRVVAEARAPISRMCVAGLFMVYEGYGSMAELLALGLDRAGVDVVLEPLALDRRGLSPRLVEMLGRPAGDRDSPVLYFAPPGEMLERYLGHRDVVASTMWETSELPAVWPTQLNRANAVIVPSRATHQAFRDSGVTVPIAVVPQGVDPRVYHFETRPQRTTLTTLMVAPICARKNTEIGIAAWQAAFASDPDARLILKSRFGSTELIARDARIRLVGETETTPGIAHWYREADVLMALGNEGFGLPPVEAMATGLPVIVLDSEGQRDLVEEAGDLVLSVPAERFEPLQDPPYHGRGLRGVPSVDAVTQRLRWVAAHREEARQIGRAASEWAHGRRNIWSFGRLSAEVVEKHARPARSLRRPRFMCTLANEWRSARYARALAEAMPFVETSSGLPDPRFARLVHVMVGSSPSTAESAAALAQMMERARALRVPFVVAVDPDAGDQASGTEDWTAASALVARDSASTARLRARWPSIPIHHIPHGRPAYFPTRKTVAGRVIAVPVDARRRGWIRGNGLETVTFSARESEDQFAIAARLAATADVVVFPDVAVDEFDLGLALASGVPVLVRNVDSMADLGGAVERCSDLREGIEQLLEVGDLRTEVVDRAREHCHANSWYTTAERHLDLWRSLESE